MSIIYVIRRHYTIKMIMREKKTLFFIYYLEECV